jgi:hypothetical protein
MSSASPHSPVTPTANASTQGPPARHLASTPAADQSEKVEATIQSPLTHAAATDASARQPSRRIAHTTPQRPPARPDPLHNRGHRRDRSPGIVFTGGPPQTVRETIGPPRSRLVLTTYRRQKISKKEPQVGILSLTCGFCCTPERIRTAVTALRGRRPRPLDDGGLPCVRPLRFPARAWPSLPDLFPFLESAPGSHSKVGEAGRSGRNRLTQLGYQDSNLD